MIIQGSEEWFAARLGRITASRIKDVMAEGKGSAESTMRRNYMAQLISERDTGLREPTYINADMQWGIDHEGEARSAFEAETGIMVEKVGFIVHPFLKYSGASPDGEYINPKTGRRRGVEIKCPKTANHIKFLLLNKFNDDYQYQMDWQTACGDYEGVDFISYDPRLLPGNTLLISPYERQEARVKEITKKVIMFNNDLNETLEKLKAIREMNGYQ